jgi:hypothetical protein
MSRPADKPAPRARAVIRGGKRGGLTPITVTEAGLEQIRRDSAEGLAISTIADRLGIGRRTFIEVRKRQPEVEEALESGRGLLADELTHLLLKKARQGDTVAMIWLSKARLGWHETGPREAAQVNVQVVNLPAPMGEGEYRRTVLAVPAQPIAGGRDDE